MAEIYSKKRALELLKPGQSIKRAFRTWYTIVGTPTRDRPWEEEGSQGVWSLPESWQEVSPGYYEERHKAEGLGEEYDPTLPTDVPEFPNISSLIDDLLNLRKREGGRKGRASTRITRGELGDLELSKTGLFPI